MVQSQSETTIDISLTTAFESFSQLFGDVVEQKDLSERKVAAIEVAYRYLSNEDFRGQDFSKSELTLGDKVALADALSDLAMVVHERPDLIKSFGCENPMDLAVGSLLLVEKLCEDTGDTTKLTKTRNNFAVLYIAWARSKEANVSPERAQEAISLLKEVVDDYGVEVSHVDKPSVDLLVGLVEAHNNLAQAWIVLMELKEEHDKGVLVKVIDRAQAARDLIETYIPTTTDKDLIGTHILLTNSIAHLMILGGRYIDAGLMLVNSDNSQRDSGIGRFKDETVILAALNLITQVEREQNADIARQLLESYRSDIELDLHDAKEAKQEEDKWLLEGLKEKIAAEVNRLGVAPIVGAGPKL